MTKDQARRWSRLLVEWGFSEVQIVESVPSGTLLLKGRNQAGQARTIASLSDFTNLRDLEVAPQR